MKECLLLWGKLCNSYFVVSSDFEQRLFCSNIVCVQLVNIYI